MKAKAPKKGRPTKKDKMVGYTFTVLESVKETALRVGVKQEIDDVFRRKLFLLANNSEI